MADAKTSIVISARDETRAAFQSVTTGLENIKGMAERVATSIPALGAAVAANGGGRLAAMASKMIEVGDRYNDLSQQIGISVRDLATWELAAKQSGTSTEGLATGVRKLAKFMAEDAGALKSLGVTATDANGALVQLAGVFAQLPDGVEKTALATKIFGKSGAELIPLLNLGAKGLAEAAEKSRLYAERLAELAPQADKFNDTVAELGLNAQAAGARIATDLLGPVNKLLEKMAEAQKYGAGFFTSLVSGARASELTGGPLQPMRDRAASLQGTIAFLTDNGRSKDPTDPIFAGKLAAARSELKLLQAEIQKRMKDAEDFGPPALPEGPSPAMLAAVRKIIGGEEKTGRAKTGKTDLERMLELGQKNALDAYYATGGEETQREVAEKQAVKSAQAATREAEAVRKLRDSYIEMIDPLEKYRGQLQQIEDLRARGLLSDDQALEAMWEVNAALDAQKDKMAEFARETEKTSDFARDMGLSFQSAFEDAIVGGKKASEVMRALAQDILRVVVRKTVTEPIGNAVSKGIDTVLNKGLGALFDAFGGGRASGGSVDPGKFYVVGERGPEILVPRSGGTVVPMGSGGSAGAPSFSFQIDARGADAGVAQRIEAGVQRAVRMSLQAVAYQAGRGGSYAKALGRA